MPQASDEERAEWGGIDEAPATEFLYKSGYRLTSQWLWLKPNKDHVVTEKESKAIWFMINEWDYAGVVGHLEGDKAFYYQNYDDKELTEYPIDKIPPVRFQLSHEHYFQIVRETERYHKDGIAAITYEVKSNNPKAFPYIYMCVAIHEKEGLLYECYLRNKETIQTLLTF